MTLKWLWILVIAFSILEYVSIPFLAVFTKELYQVFDGVRIIAFIIYPLLFLFSILFLQKGTRKVGAVILLIPLIVYTPWLMAFQSIFK